MESFIIVSKSARSAHFFGTMLLYYTGLSLNKFRVIETTSDGN